MKNKIYNLMMLTVIFALLLTACGSRPTGATLSSAAPVSVTTNGVVAEGKLKPAQAANLTFQVRGLVAEVNVKIGDQVKKGDVLARLANADVAVAQLTGAKLELLQAQQAYDQLLRTAGLGRSDAWTAYMNAQIVRAATERAWEAVNEDDIDNRVEDAKAEVQDREKDLQDAQDEFDKYKDLDKDNAKRKTAKAGLDKAQTDYNEAVRKQEEIAREGDSVRAALDTALAAEAEAKYQFELTVDGPNKETLGFLSARLENARAQVAAAEDVLSNYQLTAPFDGIVAEVAVKVGEQVTAESRAVSVADPSAWMIETTDITELEVVNVAVGQKVTFTADALSDVTMHGAVTEISQSSFVQGGDVIYTVRIQANDVDPRLKWGMTVQVIFEPLP